MRGARTGATTVGADAGSFDSDVIVAVPGAAADSFDALCFALSIASVRGEILNSVSYTHLTLPTKA